jgi:hypothetical protein
MTFIPNLQAVNSLIKGLVISSLSLFLLACNETSELGIDTLPTSDRGSVSFTEYSDINTTTILLDSVLAPTGQVFMGKYQDPELGQVTMEGYMALRTNANLGTFPTGAVYDSTIFRYGIESEYGDTAREQIIYVHMLLDTLPIKQFYSFESRTYAQVAIDTFRFKLSDANGYLSKKLNNLGKRIFDAGSPILTSVQLFNQTFKGVAFVPDAANTAVFSIDTDVSTELLVFYHTTTDSTKKSISFLMNTDNIHFSNIKTQYAGALAGLRNYGDTLSSNLAGGKFYISSLRGLRTLVKIPDLAKIKSELNGRIVAKAELVFTPLNYDFPYITNRGIVAAINDGKNRFTKDANGLTQFVYSDQQLVSAYSPGASLNSFSAFFPTTNNAWEMNITTYVNELMVGKRANTGFILFPLSFTGEAPRRTVFAANNNSNDALKPKLRLYYIKP